MACIDEWIIDGYAPHVQLTNDEKSMKQGWIRHGAASLATASLLLLGACDNPAGDDNPQVNEYAHIRASWSPDGSTIAFTAFINDTLAIYLIDPDGSNLRMLRMGDGIGVTWSPDSRWVAFTSGDTLYRMLATGDSLEPLTNGQGDIRATWSPDGSKIVFVRKFVGLMMIDLGTLSVSNLNDAGDYPSWHPNGTDLIVLHIGDNLSLQGVQFNFDALIVGTDSVRTLYSLLTDRQAGFCSISPTGEKLLFSLYPPDFGYVQLFGVDLADPRLTQLTDDGGDYGAWNHDGTQVVYTRTQKGDGALWIMNADGTGKRRLTSP